MKTMSLKRRLATLVIIPVFFLIGFSVYIALGNWREMRAAKEAHISLTLSQTASNLTHELQVERGRSAAMLSAVGDKKLQALADLKAQHAKCDDTKIAFFNELEHRKSGEQKDLLEKIQTAVVGIDGIRAKVLSAQWAPPQAIAAYSEVIAEILKLNNDTASRIKIAEISSGLYVLAVLERAKEFGGRVRAKGTATFAKDLALAPEALQDLSDNMGEVRSALQSPALILSTEGKAKVDELYASGPWKEMNEMYLKLLAHSATGTYGVQAPSFFAAATAVLNGLNEVIKAQTLSTIAAVERQEQQSTQVFFLVFAFAIGTTLMVSTIGWKMAQTLSTSLATISEQLFKGAREVEQASRAIAAASEQLSSSAEEQAAAIQETVSSVDEINAMVARNSQAAEKSNQLAEESRTKSEQGKDAVVEMVNSMGRIRERNSTVETQVKNSNQQFGEVVKVIAEIGDKAKVINEIVFQTKLLSFNASVEAARAGEHGKGFAVVAEEIGNLARMSGTAAQEIGDLLNVSTERVQNIVKSTASEMERLMTASGREVEVGTETATKCGDSLEEILRNAVTVSSVVSEIALASGEQTKGIAEVGKAMTQLDQVTNQNTSAAQEASASAEQLKSEAERLNVVVKDLVQLIHGERPQADSPVVSAPRAEPLADNLPNSKVA